MTLSEIREAWLESEAVVEATPEYKEFRAARNAHARNKQGNTTFNRLRLAKDAMEATPERKKYTALFEKLLEASRASRGDIMTFGEAERKEKGLLLEAMQVIAFVKSSIESDHALKSAINQGMVESGHPDWDADERLGEICRGLEKIQKGKGVSLTYKSEAQKDAEYIMSGRNR